MGAIFRTVVGVVALAVGAQAAAQVTFYEHDGLRGRSFTTEAAIDNFFRFGFNDRASSIVVSRGWWEVCEHEGFAGQCAVLRPGTYLSLAPFGLNDRISSVREVRAGAYDATPQPAPPVAVAPPPRVAGGRDYRRGKNERLYLADVVSVHAVFGPPEQRCWIEREQVVQDRRGGPNVPGAIVGAVIGGILGHQIGGGRGQDVATAGGAIGGAAVGANIGRGGDGTQVYTQDVQRCATVSAPGQVEFWDVTYVFQGQYHRVQTTNPPGRTITVNRYGEPRL